MSTSGPIPLTLGDFEKHLRQGGTFRTADQGLLWFQNDMFWLGQGNNFFPFPKIEGAVLAMLASVGEFEPSTIPALEGTQKKGVLTEGAANKFGHPELANTKVWYIEGDAQNGHPYAKAVYSLDETYIGGIVTLGTDGILPSE